MDRGIDCTIGELLIDGKSMCWTLEDVVRPPGAAKVFGQTAIPAGVYDIELRPSPRLGGRIVPWILNVPTHTDCQIHPGNTAADTLGCILVGEERDRDAIRRSWDAFNELMAALVPHQKAGGKIKLSITETLEPLAA